jgi:hypothetical protein
MKIIGSEQSATNYGVLGSEKFRKQVAVMVE